MKDKAELIDFYVALLKVLLDNNLTTLDEFDEILRQAKEERRNGK